MSTAPKGPPAGIKKSKAASSDIPTAPTKPGSKGTINFEEDKSSPPVNPEVLAKIAGYADRVAELKKEIEEEASYMKSLTDELFQIEATSLPDIMQEVGLDLVRTEKGLEVRIEPFVQANLPAPGTIASASAADKDELEERLAKGLAYLRGHGGEDLIKSQVIVAFGKGEVEHKQKFYDAITQKGYVAISVEGVHPQTLVSWIKEKLEQPDSDLPFDTFKIYSGKRAKVKMPVVKKPKA